MHFVIIEVLIIGGGMLVVFLFGQVIGGIGLAIAGAVRASRDTCQNTEVKVGAGGVHMGYKGSPFLVIAIVGLILVASAFFSH